jgi:glycine/D-amino acid oxidase-like deaminating enzyme
MKKRVWDVGIVGQGLAGTLLYDYLKRAGFDCCIWDPGGSSCSAISSGILNPLTGRKYVKSWLFDKLLKEAKMVYPRLEKELGIRFFYERPIYRALPDRRAENEWDYRSTLPGYRPYVGSDADSEELPWALARDVPFVSISQGHQLRINRLLKAYRSKLQKERTLFAERFEYGDLRREEGLWTYRGECCRKMVFCEGAAAIRNSFLKGLPFNLSKGEAMVVLEETPLRAVVKKSIFSVPWEKGEWWLGTANFWNYKDANPTDVGQARILSRFRQMYPGLRPPVVKNYGAIKPTTRDRRPLLGRVEDELYVFNGLGSKGASLGPYFARHFTEHIKEGKPLMSEVNISGRLDS